MQPTTNQDRRRELESLRAQIREHPERDWTAERQRMAVLSAQLAAEGEAERH